MEQHALEDLAISRTVNHGINNSLDNYSYVVVNRTDTRRHEPFGESGNADQNARPHFIIQRDSLYDHALLASNTRQREIGEESRNIYQHARPQFVVQRNSLYDHALSAGNPGQREVEVEPIEETAVPLYDVAEPSPSEDRKFYGNGNFLPGDRLKLKNQGNYTGNVSQWEVEIESAEWTIANRL